MTPSFQEHLAKGREQTEKARQVPEHQPRPTLEQRIAALELSTAQQMATLGMTVRDHETRLNQLEK